MKLRSASSREAKISAHFDSQVEGESAGDGISVISKALQNPLILDLILALLDESDLKKARLVCRYWAEIGGSLLGKRTSLNVNQFFRYDGSKLYQVTPVAQNVMRHLSITEEFHPSIPSNKKASVITKIFTNLPHVSQFTREIRFDADRWKLVTAFVNGLRKLNKSTTNIQEISVSVWDLPRTIYPPFTKKLPIQANLTSIDFDVCDNDVLRSLLQILMESAPNLTSLCVSSTFFPNLEGCKHLKVVNFGIFRSAPSTVANFDFAAAIGMLAQVKDSLTELEFRYSGGETGTPQQSQNLDVPVMSKLTSLSIHPEGMYLIQDILNEDHLPALTKLVLNIYNARKELNVASQLNLWKRHRGVKFLSLSLDSRSSLDVNTIGEQIVRLFPSVRKFELILWLDRTNSIQEVNQMMAPYQNWALEEANVRGYRVKAASVLVAILENMANWKGAKSVHFFDARIMQDDFFSSINDLILLSRGFKSVEIDDYEGVVPEEIQEIMRPILDGSGAPIRVTGGVVRTPE